MTVHNKAYIYIEMDGCMDGRKTSMADRKTYRQMYRQTEKCYTDRWIDLGHTERKKYVEM